MPIYEYRCQQCGVTFDKFVRSIAGADGLEVECPECHSKHCRKSISLFGTASSGGSSSVSDASCAPSG